MLNTKLGCSRQSSGEFFQIPPILPEIAPADSRAALGSESGPLAVRCQQNMHIIDEAKKTRSTSQMDSDGALGIGGEAVVDRRFPNIIAGGKPTPTRRLVDPLPDLSGDLLRGPIEIQWLQIGILS